VPISPDRTKRLRDLMSDYELSCRDVAVMLNRAVPTIYTWRHGTCDSIPASMLELLELKLAARGRNQ